MVAKAPVARKNDVVKHVGIMENSEKNFTTADEHAGKKFARAVAHGQKTHKAHDGNKNVYGYGR